VKIIFLSGHKEFEYAREALLYGVKDYIIKPTKYNEIMDIFSKLKDVLDKELTEKAASKQDVNGSDNYLSDNVIGRNDIIINNIKSYINENYKKATLEEIGKIVYMNPDYLSKFFKDKTGERFSDYLNAVRMKKAAEFLKDFSFKTYEVSEMVGYSNSHNFTRAFKKYYDIAPSEYRHSNNTNFKNTVNDDYR
jgi:YesN/AraC family two-component response regulator